MLLGKNLKNIIRKGRLEHFCEGSDDFVEFFICEVVERVFAVALYLYDVAVFENAQMMRSHGLFDVEFLVDFGHGHLTIVIEHFNDGNAIRVRNGAERFGAVFEEYFA